MNCLRYGVLSLLLLWCVPQMSSAESLAGRHQIGLNVGIWSQVTNARTAIGPGGITTTVKNSGPMGSLAYGYWLSERNAFSLSLGGLSASVRSEIDYFGVSTETAVVTTILLGMKQSFANASGQASVRPFLSLAIGPYIGTQTTSSVGMTVLTESRSEAAFGGIACFGADFVLSHRFLLNASAGYNLISHFSEPIGGSRNYSGPQASVGLSLLIGSGSTE